MFTGITRGTIPVVSVTHEPFGIEYFVEMGDAGVRGLELGASVSIDGVCQTAVSILGTSVGFQAIHETLRVTTLGQLKAGDRVSFERSLRAGDEIGGHDVSGHVTGVGEILSSAADGGATATTLRLRIGVQKEWLRALLPRGFVAVNGSSLTIAAVGENWFEVCLIPETLRLTNLGAKSVGVQVNIELDARTLAIVATVERVLASWPGAALAGDHS
jgi:riboflavin synthase